MRKLLGLAFLLSTIPTFAHAGFIVAAIGSIISTVGGWLAAGGVVGFLANTGIALLASAVQMAVARNSAPQQDVYRELQEPDSLPVHRFVYGQGWAPGTPAPIRVKGSKIYACYILNSRPSQGPFTLYLDKRRVQVEGDPYDFTGPGCHGLNGWFADGDTKGPHVQYWIGRGDQTSPPSRFLSEAPEYFQASDRWRGITVLWAIFRAGTESKMADRWPSAPPEVIVDGRWSKVWDPRDSSQVQTDPETWKWSRNQALCTLDALMNNPVRPYPLEHLWIESFRWAADVAAEAFPVKVGSPIPRFCVDGVLTWSEGAEIEDQVAPLLAAGASRWMRAFGQLGMLPAVYSDPVGTISEVLSEQEFVFESLRPADELYTQGYANFTFPSRTYESATTPVYKSPGAEVADQTGPNPLKLDLPFVHDYRQAQYVVKIEVQRSRMQKSMSFVAPPECADYLSGANITAAFSAPFSTRNGVYKIEEASPSEDPLGLSGSVALRVPMRVRQEVPGIYAWIPAEEEKDMPEEEFDPTSDELPAPSFLVATSGSEVAITSGDATFPRIAFTFPQVNSERISSYEWILYRRVPTSPDKWNKEASGSIEPDDSGAALEGVTPAVSNGQTYRVDVRAIASWAGDGGAGKGITGDLFKRMSSTSAWRQSNIITASVGGSLTSAPTPISATRVTTGIEVTYRTPNDSDFASFDVYASDFNNINTATFLFGPITGRNAIRSQVESGLTDGQTRYYWARSRDRRGFVSPFSGVLSATYEEA